MEIHLSQSAREFWSEAYLKLDKPLDSDFLNEVLERRAPYAIRLAMLFALSDQTRVIEVCHMQAALEWINYAVQTVKYVFADQASNPRQLETRQHAAKILAFLQLRPEGASKWELNNDCFQKHNTGEKIDAALRYLLSEHPPKIVQTETRNGKRGRMTKRYTLKKTAENYFNSQTSATPGLEGVLPPAENLRRISDETAKNQNSPQFSATGESAENPELARPADLKKFSAHFCDASIEQQPENRQNRRPKSKAHIKKI